MDEIMQMKTDMVSQLAAMLMEKYPTITMEQALDEVFKSSTYQKVQNSDTTLYYQSARYVFSFLEEELRMGKIM